MVQKHEHTEKRMKISYMFSREITYEFFWVPGGQIVFQTGDCTKCGSVPLYRAIMR